MDNLESIASLIHQNLELRTALRDETLTRARSLTRHCANAIRAVHRNEFELARTQLDESQQLVQLIHQELSGYEDLYYTGYTQDALKEYAEASIVFSIVLDEPLPTPEQLSLQSATYLQGLAEAVGELRRRCLDILREGHSEQAERLMDAMDEIFAVLVTMDFPDAITGGLRRLTDLARGIIERTRGDITISLRQQMLEESLKKLEDSLKSASAGIAKT